MRCLNGHIDQISGLRNHVSPHLHSCPVMEFNYDYTQLKPYFQEFEKNVSGI